MTQTASAIAGSPDAVNPGLAARLVGVLFTPRETYRAVAARPRSLGVLAVVALIMIGCQIAFMSTEVGRTLILDQQVEAMESFGMTVTDQMYAQMETQMERSKYINPFITLAFVPVINAICAGLLLVIFSMLLGGDGTFKQLFAIVAHSSIIISLQQLFSTPLSYASGELAGANLGVFVPMLEETSFTVRFLGAIDLFYVWWLVSLAIGVGVLYRRRTGPVATGLLSVYVVIALLLAVVRS
jgi:hypothetical protein